MIKKFNFQPLSLKDAFLIEPFVATDERGGFIKDYNVDVFKSNGIEHDLKEVFYTVSKKGVIRAIHFQRIKQQAKLVRCISGKVYDVIVDLRRDSDTFMQWQGFYLTGENYRQILVPEGFGHGYVVLEDSIVSYKCAETFYGEYDDGIKWDDKDLGIQWPLNELDCEIILSDKDKNLQSFKQFIENYDNF